MFHKAFNTKNGVQIRVNLLNYLIKLTKHVRTAFKVGSFILTPSFKGSTKGQLTRLSLALVRQNVMVGRLKQNKTHQLLTGGRHRVYL